MTSSTITESGIKTLAEKLVNGCRIELYLTPKPGLVDMLNNGSHSDLNLSNMSASINIIERYLKRITNSLENNEPLNYQVEIAKDAEKEMYEKLQTNTHKGYIFLSGLLLSAQYKNHKNVSEQIKLISMELFSSIRDTSSNGQKVREKMEQGGIVEECLNGLPSIFDHALPDFHSELRRSKDFRNACFMALASLMQTVSDSTSLHRCGEKGLGIIKRDGIILASMIRAGLPYDVFLKARNLKYVDMNLTMGGIADMLGITLALAI